jgi:hypothetical protein
MTLHINEVTALTAVNIKTDPVSIRTGHGNRANQELNLTISGTWAGTITVLRKIRKINSRQDNILVHSGADGAAALTFVGTGIVADELIGMWIRNDSDGTTKALKSMGPITDNTSTTITATLAGGTDNDFDIGDECSLWDVYATYTANQALIGVDGTDASEYMAIMSAYTSGTARVTITQ